MDHLTKKEYFLYFSDNNKKMDHFNITQECIHCLRGTRLFRVDLS